MDRTGTLKVPLLDLKLQYSLIRDEVEAAVSRVHERGNYVVGEEVEAFEEEWARYCDKKFCVAVSSGTDAIYLTAQALFPKGIPRKLSSLTVTVPAFTFPGVSEPLLRAMVNMRLCDVDDKTALMQPPGEPLKDNNWAMPTSLYGRPGEWGFGGNIFEDACQAHGAPAGPHTAVYSFYPTKNLGAYGQAGAVVTNDTELASRVRELRTYGEKKRFVHHSLSGNYRMDELQAAVLRVKLPHLDQWNTQRQHIGRLYREGFTGLPNISLSRYQPSHVHHIFALRTPHRDQLAAFLTSRGVQTAVRYPVPLHLQPCLQFLGYHEGDFPNAEAWARENLSLPIFPELEDSMVEYVIAAVREWTESQP